MARVQAGRAQALAKYTTVLSGASAANFTELAGTGAVKTTDASVQLLGQSTTRIDVPAAFSGNLEIGVSTAIAPFPDVFASAPPANRVGVIFKTDQPQRIGATTFYIGDAGYANFGASPNIAANILPANHLDWWMSTNGPTWNTSGSPVYVGNRRTKIRFAMSAGAAAKIWVAGLYVMPRPRPAFCLICDDGYDEHYAYLVPACQARNVPVSLSISRDLVGTSGFMTDAQVRELGSDTSGLVALVNHSSTNDSYSAIGLASYLSATDRCAAYLRGIGSGRGAAYHVYVQGGFDQTLIDALDARGYKAAREVGASNRVSSAHHLVWNRAERFRLPASCNLEASQPLATVQGYIETAIASGGAFVAMGHRFESASGVITWTESDMNALLDFVSTKAKQGVLDLYTLPDLINKYVDGGRAF